MAPFLIGLEEHFAGQAVQDHASVQRIPSFTYRPIVKEKLLELGQKRIDDMDEGGMGIQVVSHITITEPPDICQAVNDQLYDAIQHSNGRYRGFAYLPMGTPEAIPAELERCVRELGFVGALIPNHANGRYYEGEAYFPFWEKAQELDVPIYLHPSPAADFAKYEGNYDFTVQTLIAGPGLCWHTEVAMHLLRLYGSGLFDRYPRLKLILGHNGETVPFMLDRIDKFFGRRWGKTKRDFPTVWNENCWITTSGMWHLGPFALCLKMCKPDRILYSQ